MPFLSKTEYEIWRISQSGKDFEELNSFFTASLLPLLLTFLREGAGMHLPANALHLPSHTAQLPYTSQKPLRSRFNAYVKPQRCPPFWPQGLFYG